MSNTDLVRAAVDAINRHDPAAVAAGYAPDAVVYDPYYPEPLRGRDAIQKDFEDFLRGFPNMHVSIKSALEGGNLVAIEMVVSAVHTGPLALPSGEVPATGKKIEFEGGIFSRFNGQGLVVEEHRYYDVLVQLTQLGLIPEEQAVS
jgi:steroid delta-isomerase-like uncharacterized protein